MKSGQIYKQFVAKNGKTVTLRALKWEDLNDALEYVNNLVDERDSVPNLGILIDKKQTIETESKWLGSRLRKIETGKIISVVPEVDGKIVGNSEVTRGTWGDTGHHGVLGIGLAKEYRNFFGNSIGFLTQME